MRRAIGAPLREGALRLKHRRQASPFPRPAQDETGLIGDTSSTPGSARPRGPGALRITFAAWRRAASSLSRDVDHAGVQGAVGEGGMLSGSYLLLTGLSAAIAMLGLLLSSPAVIIGAMLLSPLMGPIVLLGFSFWMLDWMATRRALASLALGFGLAFVVALLLTLASPLKEATTEILARSRPTLFDLLVAIFSGIAGGYAVIRQRGETVIGVAIATALMPPVATIGFGVGVGEWRIAMGALLLFATNLVAIAVAAAAVAAAYGFRARMQRHGWISRVAVAAVLLALCVPLTVSLQTIALEGRATSAARSGIRAIFGARARVSSLSVRADGRRLTVDALIATPKAVPAASTRLADRLKRLASRGVQVSLDQVVLADPSRITPVAASSQPAAPQLDPAQTAEQALRQAIVFPTRSISYDPSSGSALVLLPGDTALDLAAAMAMEGELRGRSGLARTTVVPPVGRLAPLPVTIDGGKAAFGAGLAAQAWALKRWGVAHVDAEVCAAGGRKAATAAVAAALAGVFPAGAVDVRSGSAEDCAVSVVARPFVRLAPGSTA